MHTMPLYEWNMSSPEQWKKGPSDWAVLNRVSKLVQIRTDITSTRYVDALRKASSRTIETANYNKGPPAAYLNHQFGFRNKRATVGRVRRVTNVISGGTGRFKVSLRGVFIDVFDKIWHKGLLYGTTRTAAAPSGAHFLDVDPASYTEEF